MQRKRFSVPGFFFFFLAGKCEEESQSTLVGINLAGRSVCLKGFCLKSKPLSTHLS